MSHARPATDTNQELDCRRGDIGTLRVSPIQGPGSQFYLRLRLSQDKTEPTNHPFSKYSETSTSSVTGTQLPSKAGSGALKLSIHPKSTSKGQREDCRLRMSRAKITNAVLSLHERPLCAHR